MKLGYISDLVLESKFPIWEFIYPDYETDPTPKALVLGFYEHPVTGNQLMAAVNVRLLNASSAGRLLETLDDLGDGQNTIKRVRILRHLLGSVFNQAYRTYDVAKMKNVRKDSITGTEVNNVPQLGPEKDVEKETKPKTRIERPRKVERPKVDRTKPEPQELPQKAQRGKRGLEALPTRPEDEVQRSDRSVPDLADEEY